MTEYDYSPAAYERYIAQQARVSNWVDDTLQQSHAYSDPFVLSPTLRDRSFYDEPGHSPHSRHPHNAYDQWSMGSSRPSRTRSRSYVDHAHYDRSAAPRYRTQSHSRSPTTRDIEVIYPPHGSQPYIYPQPHGMSRAPPSHSYQYPSANGHIHSSSRQAYATQPPPGQVYHLSPNAPPPPPRDTSRRHTSHSRHHSSKPAPQPYLVVQGGGPKAEYKRGPPIHAPIPTKPHAQQQPLLKRLLGFVTMSPVGGRSGNGRGYRGSSY